jgi:hypothetical protein
MHKTAKALQISKFLQAATISKVVTSLAGTHCQE